MGGGDPQEIVGALARLPRVEAGAHVEAAQGQRHAEPERLRRAERERRRDVRESRAAQQRGDRPEDCGGIGRGGRDEERLADARVEVEREEAHRGGAARHRRDVSGARAGVEREQGQRVREHEGRMQPTPRAAVERHAAAAQQHCGDAEVLAGVVPGTPGHVEREHAGGDDGHVYRQREERDQQRGRMDGKERVRAPVVALLVDAQEGRAVMRRQDQQRGEGDEDRSLVRAQRRADEGQGAESRHVPEPAAEEQVSPRSVEPARRGIRGRGGHRRSISARARGYALRVLRHAAPSAASASEASAVTDVVRYAGGVASACEDAVAREEPLEIQLGAAPLAVVMRTPGHDEELACGFLVTERVVDDPTQIVSVRHCRLARDPASAENVVRVVLADGVRVDLEALRRNLYASSSCGICGKATAGERARDRATARRPRALRAGALLRTARAAVARAGGLRRDGRRARRGALRRER